MYFCYRHCLDGSADGLRRKRHRSEIERWRKSIAEFLEIRRISYSFRSRTQKRIKRIEKGVFQSRFSGFFIKTSVFISSIAKRFSGSSLLYLLPCGNRLWRVLMSFWTCRVPTILTSFPEVKIVGTRQVQKDINTLQRLLPHGKRYGKDEPENRFAIDKIKTEVLMKNPENIN